MRSLRLRLIILWLLSLVASLAVGALLVQLYRQSTAAEVARAETQLARGCDMIRDRYAFYVARWHGPLPDAATLRPDLTAAVWLALTRLDGIEGGVWRQADASLAYAYPTYEGSGPKTDLPEAERDSIRAVNEAALADQAPVLHRMASRRQTLLLFACPLGESVAGLSGWTMTRVQDAPGLGKLQLGLGVLLALMLGMSGWLAWLAIAWSRRIGGIERALAGHDLAALPALPRTGERELDRIVDALNGAGRRLAEARARSDALAARVTAAERLAALGRVAAGIAHEIRNPIAAMRLKAENAIAGDEARRQAALPAILGQIARLDRLVGGLLAMTQRRKLDYQSIDLAEFLRECAADRTAEAETYGVRLEMQIEEATARRVARFDQAMIHRVLDNLLGNAIRHSPGGSTVTLHATAEGSLLRLSVSDQGPGVAPALRESLFEPFVTGRADGTGLGLAIARELVSAHGGVLHLADPGGARPGEGAVFTIELPEACA